MPLDVVDGTIYFGATQRVREDLARPGQLHVEAYEYRVGWSAEGRDWLVRWEYEEDSRPGFPYPRAHFHVNGASANPAFIPDLGRAHFATQKILLEQVLLSVCADIVQPRLEARGRSTASVQMALLILEGELAVLAGRGLL